MRALKVKRSQSIAKARPNTTLDMVSRFLSIMFNFIFILRKRNLIVSAVCLSGRIGSADSQSKRLAESGWRQSSYSAYGVHSNNSGSIQLLKSFNFLETNSWFFLGHRYHFSLRAMDVHGSYSEPRTIVLSWDGKFLFFYFSSRGGK